jgi:hypothetical protein
MGNFFNETERRNFRKAFFALVEEAQPNEIELKPHECIPGHLGDTETGRRRFTYLNPETPDGQSEPGQRRSVD